ncbi:MAG: cell wall-binding repeat-containing protein [Gracilibacteraceae bacterium]|nr:cell wall-binding repeat-containing protein [Gracilibacteraceae bacterium]
MEYHVTNGEATVELPPNTVAELIAEANSANSSQAVVSIDVSEAQSVVTATLPATALAEFADADVTVEIKLPQGSLTLTAELAEQIAAVGGNGDISLGIQQVDPATDLNLLQQAAVGDAPVFDISITANGANITTSFNGLLSIRLPYDLKPGQKANGVAVYYLDEFGNIHKMSAMYDALSHEVLFTTDHLSTFMIGYSPVTSTPNGGSGGGAAVQIPEDLEPEAAGPGIIVSKASLSYISGQNRVETSLAISRRGWTSADTVIIAPGGQNNLIDALAVAPLAGQENAPILLSMGSIDPAVIAEIQRLGAKKIYVVGALDPAVVDALKRALPNVTIETLTGANRLETAALVNSRLTGRQGTFVVGYNATADAVSAAAYAAANGYAIQIANPDGSLSGAPVGQTYILGGPSLVSDIAGATRLYGATRYETNQAVRDALTFDYTNIYTADGNTLVDALTGSALAAQTRSAIVLTPGNDPTGVDFGGITQETTVYAFGGAK